MRKKWRNGALLMVVAASSAFPAGLGLDSLIGMGLTPNAELLAAGQQAETFALDTLIGLAPANPSLALEAMHNVSAPSKPKASVKLSQEFRPGYRNHVYQSAKARVSAEKEWQRARELDLIHDIRSSFFEWQFLNQKADLQREVERRWDALSRLAAAKMAEGKISQVDEAQTRLNLAKARQKELEIRTGMIDLEKQLGFLSGAMPLPDSIRPEPMDSIPAMPPMDSLVAWAERLNPDVKTLQKEIEFSKAQISVEQNLKNPSFNLSLGYERETDGGNLIGGGVELPLPLFNRNQAAIGKARSSLREAELKKNAAEVKARADLSELYAKLTSLAVRYRNYQAEIRELSRKQLDLSDKGFRQGLLGVFELSRVQEEALNQDMDALDVLAEYFRFWNRLGRTVGGKTW